MSRLDNGDDKRIREIPLFRRRGKFKSAPKTRQCVLQVCKNLKQQFQCKAAPFIDSLNIIRSSSLNKILRLLSNLLKISVKILRLLNFKLKYQLINVCLHPPPAVALNLHPTKNLANYRLDLEEIVSTGVVEFSHKGIPLDNTSLVDLSLNKFKNFTTTTHWSRDCFLFIIIIHTKHHKSP